MRQYVCDSRNDNRLVMTGDRTQGWHSPSRARLAGYQK
jgi:hypothetical protein